MHWWVDPTPERLQKALASAQRAIELDPTAPEGHRALGLYYYLFERRDLDAALDELTRAAELLPNDSSVQLWIGGVLSEQGRWNEALTHYEEAVELDPRRPQVLIALGGTYRQLRQYREAIRYVDLVISLEPDVGEWYLQESAIYMDWGQLEKARETLESAPRMEDDALLLSWWSLEWWAGNNEAALDRLADAPEMFVFFWGKLPRAFLEAVTYDAMKDRESARASYAAALSVVEEALAETPDDEQLRRRLGRIYSGLGRKDEAIREMEGWVERMSGGGPTYHAWLRELAGVYAAVGEPEKALDQLEYLLSIPSLLSYGQLRYDPALDPLRDHPRFQKLLAQAERELPPPPPS
jgi:tetratricopeptide (TPR) repeat protein